MMRIGILMTANRNAESTEIRAEYDDDSSSSPIICNVSTDQQCEDGHGGTVRDQNSNITRSGTKRDEIQSLIGTRHGCPYRPDGRSRSKHPSISRKIEQRTQSPAGRTP